MEEQVKVPVFKGALIYGVIVGLALIVFSLLIYFVGQSLETWAMIAQPIIFLGLIVGSLIMFKKEYGKGFASFGRLVFVSFIVGTVTAILTAGFSYAIYELDEGYLQDTKYYAIDKVEKQFDKIDAKYQEKMSDEQYDKVEKEMRKQKKKAINKIQDRSGAKFALSGIFSSIFMAVIIGLIAGIFIKKEQEPSLPEA